MNEDKLKVSTATGGITPGYEDKAAPGPINPATGQHTSYWILSDEERQKGFVRPVRFVYRHVGIQPQYELRDLTDEERERYADTGYVKFESYPESELPVTGRFWTQAQLDAKACYETTRMAQAIAETYARDPNYYGSTFCIHCGKHLPVAEFIWEDGSRVGS